MTLHETTWRWLSFCGDDGFLGAAITEGASFIDAARAAVKAGCNPGGDVLGQPISDRLTVPEDYQNRLLTKEECIALDAIFVRQLGGSGDGELVRVELGEGELVVVGDRPPGVN